MAVPFVNQIGYGAKIIERSSSLRDAVTPGIEGYSGDRNVT
jgi:hypothetical protein